MIKRHKAKSCCGKVNHIFETDKPIKKSHVEMFKNAGFAVPDNYLRAGIFWIRGNNIVATATYGATRINVQCHGGGCDSKLNSFAELLEKAVHS
jgi:hypothetical protein